MKLLTESLDSLGYVEDAIGIYIDRINLLKIDHGLLNNDIKINEVPISWDTNKYSNDEMSPT